MKSTLTCTCGEPRLPGRRQCQQCRNAERRERYDLDPAHRRDEKARRRTWGERHREDRAAYMRDYRARTRAKEA